MRSTFVAQLKEVATSIGLHNSLNTTRYPPDCQERALWVPHSCTTREMVLTRPQHHNRRGVPGGITFGHNMGCQLACCNPGSRQELATRRLPLPYDCRIAFLMGCSRAVPRLAEDCAPSLRRMPLEVVRRIIELCTRCAHELSPQHTP